jgi:phosphate transport system substrate-binding protein
MPSRRALLRSAAVLGVSTLAAGCSGVFESDTTTGRPARSDSPERGATTTEPPETDTPPEADPLRVATSGLLADPVSRAAALWNGNRGPTDDEYGRTLADRLGSTGPGVAGYFAGRHGFAPTGTPHRPPYRVAVGDNGGQHSLAALRAGTVDIATPGAEVFSPLAEETDLSGLVRHDLFRTGKAFVVSEAVYEAGVTSVTREALLGIHNGRPDNWAALGGPDREIHLAGTVDVQGGPEVLERTFLRNQPGGGADARYGQAQRKVAVVDERDDALTRVAVPDVESLREGGRDGYRILAVEVDGEPRGPTDAGYPGTYPVALFTEGAPDRREAAFLEALSAEPVQPAILNEDGDRLVVLPAATPPDA